MTYEMHKAIQLLSKDHRCLPKTPKTVSFYLRKVMSKLPLFMCQSLRINLCVRAYIYYMAELVHGGKEHSDWFPERSESLLYGPLRWTSHEVI